MKNYSLTNNLLILSSAHGIIDALTIWLVFYLVYKYQYDLTQAFYLILLYNGLAFATQFILGLILDKIRNIKPAIVFSLLLAGLALLLLNVNPLCCLILAGLSNAIFHVSAGTVSLNLTPGKAVAPGIFVAPGALGVFLGLLLGKNGYLVFWPFLILLIVYGLLIWRLTLPQIDYHVKPVRTNQYFILIFLCLFLTILIRALIGTVAIVPWKSDLLLLLVLTVAVVLGKGLGGLMADKYGWLKVTVIATLLAAPLLAFTLAIPILSIVGFYLFNITMPVTLVALAKILPGRPGFAFGLTCLALFGGLMLALYDVNKILSQPLLILLVILISTGFLYNGLKLLNINSTKHEQI